MTVPRRPVCDAERCRAYATRVLTETIGQQRSVRGYYCERHDGQRGRPPDRANSRADVLIEEAPR